MEKINPKGITNYYESSSYLYSYNIVYCIIYIYCISEIFSSGYQYYGYSLL